MPTLPHLTQTVDLLKHWRRIDFSLTLCATPSINIIKVEGNEVQLTGLMGGGGVDPDSDDNNDEQTEE